MDSALSNRSKTSVVSSYELSIISDDISISFLWINFCKIILEWNSIWADEETFWVNSTKYISPPTKFKLASFFNWNETVFKSIGSCCSKRFNIAE